MERIQEIHDELYDFLIHKRQSNKNLTFTLRKSNHANRLEEGFWFYGGKDYVAVSFWAGMDWKSRLPNIAFIISLNRGCYLEINVSDSADKLFLVENYMFENFNLVQISETRFRKYYEIDTNFFINYVEYFLEFDKVGIDNILKFGNSEITTNGKDNSLGFIGQKEFNSRNVKIKRYQKLKKEFLKEDDDFWVKENKPSKLFSIKLKNFGPIKSLLIDLESKRNQWTILTGPNGSGKTIILKVLATFFGNKILSRKELNLYGDFQAQGDLIFKNDIYSISRGKNSINSGGSENQESVLSKRRPLIQGLAAYGPYRLDVVSEKISREKFNQKLLKKGSFQSLFSNGEPLLNLNKQLEYWKKGNKRERDIFEKRKYFIVQILTEIVPDLINIEFQGDHDRKITKYIFIGEDNKNQELPWEDLSSGTRNIIALIGDILIRMYDQQREIMDPGELRGIVIIDEIDLHLHPQAQKDLVINLTRTFPNVQFIASTHSPIPLLGVPKETVVFVTKYNNQNGITIERIDNKIFLEELLPNTILTSPIFGMNDITNENRDNEKFLRAEESFEELDLVDKLEKSIEEFITNKIEEDLIERLNKKRK